MDQLDIRTSLKRAGHDEIYSIFFNNSNDAILVLEMPSASIIDLNPAAFRLYGYNEEEMIGMSFSMLSAEPETTVSSLNKRKRYNPIQYHKKKDGRNFIVDVSASFFEKDGMTCAAVIIRDITLRIKAEQRLEQLIAERTDRLNIANEKLKLEIAERKINEIVAIENKEKAKLFFEASIDSVLVIDKFGLVLDINSAGAARFNVTPNEILGKKIYNFIPGKAADFRKKMIDAVMSAGEAYSFEDSMNGRYYLNSIYPIKDMSGEVTQATLFSKDITELRRSEYERNLAFQEMDAMFNSTSIGMFLIDEDCNIIKANDSLLRILNITRKNFINKKCNIVMDQPNCQAGACECFEAFKSGVTKHFEIKKNIDGQERSFAASAVPIKTYGHNSDVLLISLADISEIRNLQKEIITISEAERQQIGHELHDGVGQLLTGVGFLVEAMEKKLESLEYPNMSEMNLISDLNHQAIDLIRNLSNGLSPIQIKHRGLEIALDNLAEESSALFKVKVNFEHEGSGINDSYVETHLYYIAREAIHNAIKHGTIGSVDVFLNADENNFTLKIINRFGAEKKSQRSKGMGLKIMRYRAQLIGASFDASAEGDIFIVSVEKG